jgi:hypothetical protein
MKGNAPILVTPLYGTASGPILVLGCMNDKHYTSTQIRSRQSKAQPLDAAAAKSPAEQAADQGNAADAGQGPTVGPDKAEGAASKAAANQQGWLEDAVNGDLLPYDLQWMNGNDSQTLDAAAVMAAAKSPAEQAVDQGSTADAGQGPALGPDKAVGAVSTMLGPADGPDKTQEAVLTQTGAGSYLGTRLSPAPDSGEVTAPDADKEEDNQKCDICGGLHSEPPNQIVFCTNVGCDSGAHQLDLNPPLVPLPPDDEDWYCGKCVFQYNPNTTVKDQGLSRMAHVTQFARSARPGGRLRGWEKGAQRQVCLSDTR